MAGFFAAIAAADMALAAKLVLMPALAAVLGGESW